MGAGLCDGEIDRAYAVYDPIIGEKYLIYFKCFAGAKTGYGSICRKTIFRNPICQTWRTICRRSFFQFFQILKRTIPHNVSVATKLLFYRLCVHSILLYGSQMWYPSISQRRQLEFFNRKCLYWVTGLWDYNLQLSRTRTLPISFYLVLQDLIFLNKSIKGKYDLNIQNFICFSSNVRNLRTSHCQLLTPVSKCNKFTSRQSYFQRVCQWSNFLSERNIDITQSCENF